MNSYPKLFSSSLNSKMKRWNLKALFLLHLLILFLFASLFFPPTKALWKILDTTLFHLLNSTLEGPLWWQTFWAAANHPWADWLEDLCILSFFAAYLFTGSPFVRPRRLAELLLCAAYSAAVIYFFNRLFIREQLHYYWPSPSAFFENAIHLNDKIPWISIKDSSLKSFPGDHATTALLFASFYGYLVRGRLALFAAAYAALLCLPRLITGAHWVSDILVGSASIVLFFLSWLFCSPLFHTLSNLLEKSFILLLRLKRKWARLEFGARDELRP
ncbi:MAG: hypothetical protein A2Y28_03495 [Chlamydiae bacterium GWC2_50_10]|nr:MAG: hypothetical protein A2Y28_03495 [Chlamydiae bacterium GWC2_50_10]OGN64423.1 MAG: hypothetical protein A3E26_05615 [Chlamydiae bacterium RIFCSPHIGHO2_12_FULL_49_32]HCJ84217.1 hypothetical protein [Parachlamydiales bacterium]